MERSEAVRKNVMREFHGCLSRFELCSLEEFLPQFCSSHHQAKYKDKVNRAQGSPEQVLAERIAGKIGMIIRRATQVVAGLRCQGAQRHERTILPQPYGTGLCERLSRQAPSEGTPQSVARGAPQSGDRAAAGMSRPRLGTAGAQASRSGVASSSGRDCSALRGRTIRVVAFRASHPAKPPWRQ
jgi:hypothetical protein